MRHRDATAIALGIAALAAAISGAVLASMAGKDWVGGSAVAAAVAAYGARDTARESRRALALHFRPDVGVNPSFDYPAQAGKTPWARVSATVASPHLSELTFSWTSPSGNSYRRAILTGDPNGEDVELTDCQVLPEGAEHPVLTDAQEVRMSCVVEATGARWRAIVRPNRRGVAMAPVPHWELDT